MSTPSIALANVTLTPPTAEQPVAAEGINKLPLDILANIASFLSTREKLSTMSQVCKEWNNLPFDGEHLDLSKVKNLSDQDLRNILDGIENRGGKITSVYLYGCSITDRGLAYLAKLSLTSLDLSWFRNITDAGFTHLAKLSLTSLNLHWCDNITDAGLAHLTKLPLTSLDLSECENITNAGLAHLAKLPLTSLDLTGCKNITDAGLAHLGGLHLTSLNLTSCRDITDAGVAHLAELPLTSLNLSGCRNITDAGLAYLAELPLTSLNLHWCENITNAGLAHLAKLHLTSLDLAECENITDAGLAYLAKLHLTSVALHRCDDITDAGARAFKAGLIPAALTDVRLRGKIDHYVCVLASQPKGGDRWGEIHRYEDHNRLRLAQAIAAQTLNSESFKDSWLEKSLNVIEIIDLTGSSVLNVEQRARIDALLGAIPANIRSDVDDQVYALAPEPKGGKNWDNSIVMTTYLA